MVRTLRLRETVFPFGVGAIADISGESFIGLDTTEWPLRADELRCDRLADELGVSGFKSAPTMTERTDPVDKWSRGSKSAPEQSGLVYMRFPRWRFCERCGLMSDSVPRIKGISRNICESCSSTMVPMRFVAVCEAGGHITDIPWPLWVHRKSNDDTCVEKNRLEFVNRAGAGEGLQAIFVKCRACGAQRNFGELSSPDSLRRDGFRCFGKQPWETGDGKSCAEKLLAVQRGSTSLYKPELVSAIDIPVAERRNDIRLAPVRNHYLFDALTASRGDRRAQLVDMIASDTGVDRNVIAAAVAGEAGTAASILRNLHGGEWEAFTDRMNVSFDAPRDEDFDVRTADRPFNVGELDILHTLIDDVGLVHRIRQVTVQRWFRRYRQERNHIPVDLGRSHGQTWLPAVEQYGEGVFVRFSEQRISSWEKKPEVRNRAQRLLTRANESLLRRIPAEVPPRFILLHTLAHLMIRQFEFYAGYPAASMSERIYAESTDGEQQAGILIFTGSGDVEGTLGGLVRLAEPDLFGRLLTRAIESGDWCGNDPICGENLTQGVNSSNFAACHSCSLLPETSCESANTVLDRRMLVDPEQKTGFFDEVLELARQAL